MATVLAVYGTCQTGCNAAYVACCAAAGFVAGTFTAGAGAPPALVYCSAQQGLCMTSCAAMSGIAGVAEAGAAATATGGATAAASAVLVTVSTPLVLGGLAIAGGGYAMYSAFGG